MHMEVLFLNNSQASTGTPLRGLIVWQYRFIQTNIGTCILQKKSPTQLIHLLSPWPDIHTLSPFDESHTHTKGKQEKGIKGNRVVLFVIVNALSLEERE